FLVAIWIYSERWSSRLFFYAWFPIGVVLSSYVVGADQSAYLAANAYDRAGIVARALLSSQERSRTLILGPEPTGLFRTLFHLDSAGARFQVISPDSPIDMDLLSKHRDWLLVFGDPPLALAANEPFMIGGARLVRLARERKLDFSKAQWFGVVVHTRGLSDPEP